MTNFNELFYYDPSSPTCIRHKINKNIKTLAGDPAGTFTKKGSPSGVITFKDEMGQHSMSIPKFILQEHGEEVSTTDMILHLDGDKRNNRIENLQVVSRTDYYLIQEMWNHRDSKEGMKFITESKSGKYNWLVQISVNKQRFAKRFIELEEAQEFVANNLIQIKRGTYVE